MTYHSKDHLYIPTRIEELPAHPNEGFDRFVRALGDGRLQPGTTLTQAQLCDFLDLSLSPLREALVLLEEYGLVKIKPRAGLTIVNPELAFVRENYQFRILIETEALNAFIDSVPDGWINAVRSHQEEVLTELAEEKTHTEAMAKFVAFDEFLHSSFVAALKNKSIQATHLRLLQNIRMVRTMHETVTYRRHLADGGREHLDLLDSIETKDKQKAAATLRRHFESSIYRAVVSP